MQVGQLYLTLREDSGCGRHAIARLAAFPPTDRLRLGTSWLLPEAGCSGPVLANTAEKRMHGSIDRHTTREGTGER